MKYDHATVRKTGRASHSGRSGRRRCCTCGKGIGKKADTQVKNPDGAITRSRTNDAHLLGGIPTDRHAFRRESR